MIRKIYLFLSLIIIGFLLTSCKPLSGQNVSTQETNTPAISQKAVENKTDEFVVKGWVQKSDSNNGKTVIVMANLIKNGFIEGDKNLHVTWPDPSKVGGIGSCDVISHHGTGNCVVYTDHLTPGVYVPVTLKFECDGNYYYGETGFTPE